jgi:hypothetical protein
VFSESWKLPWSTPFTSFVDLLAAFACRGLKNDITLVHRSSRPLSTPLVLDLVVGVDSTLDRDMLFFVVCVDDVNNTKRSIPRMAFVGCRRNRFEVIVIHGYDGVGVINLGGIQESCSVPSSSFGVVLDDVPRDESLEWVAS